MGPNAEKLRQKIEFRALRSPSLREQTPLRKAVQRGASEFCPAHAFPQSLMCKQQAETIGEEAEIQGKGCICDRAMETEQGAEDPPRRSSGSTQDFSFLLQQVTTNVMTSNGTNVWSCSSLGGKPDPGLTGLRQGVRRAAFLLEAPGQKLGPCFLPAPRTCSCSFSAALSSTFSTSKNSQALVTQRHSDLICLPLPFLRTLVMTSGAPSTPSLF